MRRLSEHQDNLGECPTWDGRADRFVWIDVTGKRLQSCRADGSGLAQQGTDDYPGSLALRQGGGLLVAFRRSLALLDAEGHETKRVTPPGIDFGTERFNDGKCDAQGRFWVGTMDRKLAGTVGAFYRVDPDLSVTRFTTGYGVSNGIAWSPDERTVYHCDSNPAVVHAYDFDATQGTVANRRPFATFAEGMGCPDGCASDTEGFLWVASPGAGCVRRFAPDGREESRIETPVRYPSSVGFGGLDLRTLFVTSLVPHEHAPPGDADPSKDGAVFALDVGVAGLPVGRFAG